MPDQRHGGKMMWEHLGPRDKELQPCHIYIDKEGDWYYLGSPMQRQDIVSLLCTHLGRHQESGLFVIRFDNQECYVEVEDTPLVIQRVDLITAGDGNEIESVLLAVKHWPQPQNLDPTTLQVGAENVLYAAVGPERLPARFLRPAYYQLATAIQYDQERQGYYLEIGGKRHCISAAAATVSS